VQSNGGCAGRRISRERQREIDEVRRLGVTRANVTPDSMKELILFLYLLLFVGAVLALRRFDMHRRKRRMPFAQDLKLLRVPGETQLEKVHVLEDRAIFWAMGAAFVPIALLIGLVRLAQELPETLRLGGAALALLISAGAFVASVRWFLNRAGEISNRYLGYFGERVVAECLEPLKAQGWRVFHDVPAAAGVKEFNLDHVAVGPGGVAVIETKTRRKSTNTRPGFEGHKVFFDGHELVWPWGEDSHGLGQAERNAVWLADTLLEETGERIPVMPILALPGWWVEMKPASNPRACRVTNPKNLPQLLSRGPTVLTESQHATIVMKLEQRCRTVMY
jgi:hypothetical protein